MAEKENESNRLFEDEKVIEIEIERLRSFKDHPFKVTDDKEMHLLKDSIKQYGVLNPLIVRPVPDGVYEIISGHRRWQIGKELKLDVVPVYVREFSKEEAVINFVDCNLSREKILPSEKARAYKMKHDAIKKQGARTDLTSSQVGTKFRSDEMLAETMPNSRMQIQRYIRLNNLQPALLDMVDEKRLALSVAVELSYMNKNVQQWIYEFIRENGMIKQEQLMELRKYRDDKNMTQEQLITILIGSASTVPTSKKITLNERKLHKFFPAYYSKAEMERVIFGLLEQWKQAQDSEEK